MLLLIASALAYETDQLTDRLLPLRDATEEANRWANDLLAAAVARTNAATRCEGSDAQVRRVLGREIAQVTARSTFVRERKLAGFGYGAYAALLETGDIPRHSFFNRDDIYGALRPGESVVLSSVGTCSTVRLAGELVGTDKPDHFWALGYQYAVVSRWGERPERAVDWGTFTERSFYGLLTSNVFSYADLAANEAGYRFFVELLTPQSSFIRGEDGCVVQLDPFDWEDWVDPSWDEVLNPSVFNRYVDAAVQERLAARRGDYCANYLYWRDDYLPQLAMTLSDEPPYVGARAPTRRDPYRLEQLCSDYITAALADGRTRTPGPVDTASLLLVDPTPSLRGRGSRGRPAGPATPR